MSCPLTPVTIDMFLEEPGVLILAMTVRSVEHRHLQQRHRGRRKDDDVRMVQTCMFAVSQRLLRSMTLHRRSRRRPMSRRENVVRQALASRAPTHGPRTHLSLAGCHDEAPRTTTDPHIVERQLRSRSVAPAALAGLRGLVRHPRRRPVLDRKDDVVTESPDVVSALAGVLVRRCTGHAEPGDGELARSPAHALRTTPTLLIFSRSAPSGRGPGSVRTGSSTTTRSLG